jgi:Fe-Mn family superoxide dismutase
MKHELPDLPYEKNALEPYISAETLEYHHDKHHKTYVDKLNDLIEGSEFADASLEDIIRNASGDIFNNGAQVWYHTFYWHCMSPSGGGEPGGRVGDAFKESFGSFKEFKEIFTSTATATFGSGWTWLVKQEDGSLAIQDLSDAGNPLREGLTPILTLDMWEHAYYIDYRNQKGDYLDAFWRVVNWQFAEKNL